MTVNFGNKVKIDYVLKVDGIVYDTSIKDVAIDNEIYTIERTYQPLVLEVGSKEFIKGLSEGLLGMELGETKDIVIPPSKGYGFRDESKVQTMPRKLIERDGVDITPGTRLKITTPNGMMIAVVTELTDDEVTFDFNPDLCDKVLSFHVCLKDILS